MTTSKNTSWIKKVESLVAESQTVPMWGTPPPFPWESFTNSLTESLSLSDLKISPGTSEWKKGREVLSGMGRTPLHIALEFFPLKGSFSFVFPSEDFSKLSSWLIHPKATDDGFSDPYLQKGFFRYLSLEAIACFDHLETFKGLSPKVIDMPLAKEDAYCVDIAIEHNKKTIWGRLICPTIFQESFKTHFASAPSLSTYISSYEEISLPLSLSSGDVTLDQETFKNLKNGDFILLDHTSYFPSSGKGTFKINLNHTPLFQTKIKQDSIKILDYALYYEDNKMSDESFDMDQSIEEELPPSEGENKIEVSKETDLISPKKVPISLTVEVGKLNMNLDTLLKLKPGNVLNLSVQPENSVHLVSNGKSVAKGDLIQIGDVVGVKITQIGG